MGLLQNKKGMIPGGFWGIIGIVAVVALVTLFATGQIGGSGDSNDQQLGIVDSDGAAENPAAAKSSCPAGVVYEDVSVTLNTVENMNDGTTVTDTIGYRVNDGPVQTTTSGTAITQQFNVGDKFEIVTAYNNTANTWYSVAETIHVPCQGTWSPTFDTGDIDSSSFFTVTIKNDDGDTVNAGNTTGQQTAPGDSLNYEVKLKGSFEDWYGAKTVGICLEYPVADYQEVTLSRDGEELSPLATPKRLTSASGNVEDCYVDKAFRSSETRFYSVDVQVDEGASITEADDLLVTIIDDDYFLSRDNDFELGYEDNANSNADVGDGDETATINVLPVLS